MKSTTSLIICILILCIGTLISFSNAIEKNQIENQNQNNGDYFSEQLLLRPLKDKSILAHFQFVQKISNNNVHHFDQFPKAIGQMVDTFSLEEMHLSFTQGRWLSNKWNFPIHAAPVGVELFSWFQNQQNNNNNTKESVEKLWKGLTYTLAGVFCASMEEMGESLTSNSHFSFRPRNINKTVDNNLFRYSNLPREAVCTENLTPWSKLLPCRNKAGIASLLNAIVLYNVPFHSMGLEIYRDGSSVEVKHTLSVVFSKKDFNLNSLFQKNSVSKCALAQESKIFIDLSLVPSQIQSQTKFNEIKPNLFEYDLTDQEISFDIAPNSNQQDLRSILRLDSTPIFFQRFLTGHGQEFGGLSFQITNSRKTTISFVYTDFVPWYLRLFLHTMSVSLNEQSISIQKAFSKYRLIPGEDHSSPAIIEFETQLKPNDTLHFTIQFEKAFLHWTEHPPDANRGFDIGSASITLALTEQDVVWSPFQIPNKEGVVSTRVYTEGSLVALPTPDFSMPYNVITLTGTILALFFGSVFNLLIRRMRFLEKIGDDYVSNRPIARILRKITQFLEIDT